MCMYRQSEIFAGKNVCSCPGLRKINTGSTFNIRSKYMYTEFELSFCKLQNFFATKIWYKNSFSVEFPRSTYTHTNTHIHTCVYTYTHTHIHVHTCV